jgi:L-lactate dehydrogenase complex protein LldE
LNISLFIACYNDTLFPETGVAVVNVLERLGHRVDFPRAQTCCGQMHYNSGYQEEALPLVRKFVEIFRDAEAVCIPSGSCVAMIREQYLKIAAETEDPRLMQEVESLLPRVYEFTELLVDKLGLEDVGAFYPHRVTYHASCHSLRGLHIGDIPLRLLRNVRGLELIELPEWDQCCGFGGTFAVKNAETSAAMLADKLKNIVSTGAEICTAGDNSCLMHIFGGLHRQQAKVKTVHIAEILASTESASSEKNGTAGASEKAVAQNGGEA